MRLAVLLALVATGCASSTTADFGPHGDLVGVLGVDDAGARAEASPAPAEASPAEDAGPTAPEAGTPDVVREAAPEASVESGPPPCDAPTALTCQNLDQSQEAAVCSPPRCVLPGFKLFWSVEPDTCCTAPCGPASAPYAACDTTTTPNPYLTSLGDKCLESIAGFCYLVELTRP